MVDNAGTNHIQIDVYQASQQMFTGFNGGRMVSILPEGTFPVFPTVIFLGSSSGDKRGRAKPTN